MLAKLFRWSVYSVVLLCVHAAGAQDLRQISPEEARQHIVKRVEPAYPSDAEMARIQGKIVVRVTIDEHGNVTEEKAISGHPLLVKAALTAAKQWKFQPFTQGVETIPVSSTVQIDFWLGPGAAQQREYLQQEVECVKQLQNKTSAEAEAPCKKALETARKLPDNFALDKLHAYGDAANAASNANQTNEAVEDFKQQLEVAQHTLQAGNPQIVLIHSHLAHACQAADQILQADAEFTETEKAQEAAQSELESSKDKITPSSYGAVRVSYAHNMQIILHKHAALLRGMGKDAEAEVLEKKANSLVSSQVTNPSR
jgi:TonB family protein